MSGFDLPGGESTSARLRQVQADLAASQADLTRAERERDRANELTDKIAAELRGVTRARDALARRCALRFQEAVQLRAELASARQENAQLRGQIARLQANPSEGVPTMTTTNPGGEGGS